MAERILDPLRRLGWSEEKIREWSRAPSDFLAGLCPEQLDADTLRRVVGLVVRSAPASAPLPRAPAPDSWVLTTDSVVLRLGTPGPFATSFPSRYDRLGTLHARQLFANVHWSGFALLDQLVVRRSRRAEGFEILEDEVTALEKSVSDQCSPIRGGAPLDLVLGRHDRVAVRGRYTGYVPPGYERGAEYLLGFDFEGRFT